MDAILGVVQFGQRDTHQKEAQSHPLRNDANVKGFHRLKALVADASGPPPDSKFGFAWLVRGIAGLATMLANAWRRDGKHYVGEWHFHPYSSPGPSGRDRDQMRKIARDDRYQCADPVLLIVGGDPAGTWSLHVEVHGRDGTWVQLKQAPGAKVRPRTAPNQVASDWIA
jgi:Prokaryotic homologs of the JAB domain